MKKSLLFIVILLAASACSDFLDIRPEGTTTAEGIDYGKKENIIKPVSAAYATLRSYDVSGFPYICVLEITSDDADKGSEATDGADALALDEFKYLPSNTHIGSQWTGWYDVVSAANNVLFQMEAFRATTESDETLAEIRQCEAEGRFLRAYAYFYLVRMFGAVPKVDRAMTSEELASLERTPATGIWQFIEEDLQDAIDHLPASYPSAYKGRATCYTAMAFKAKAHLYQGEYAQVARLCDELIASRQFGLIEDFRAVFSLDNELSKESIFEIQSSTLGKTSGSAAYSNFAYYQGPRGGEEPLQGWGFCVPSDKLIRFFEQRGDTERARATLLYTGRTTPEGDFIKGLNPVYNGKVYMPSYQNTWGYNAYGLDYNIRIMRYSEVLLMYAEALARGASPGVKSGYTAQQALDEVRKRAKLPSVEPTLDNILNERRAELAMEEDRFLDLVRTGRAATELRAKGYVEGKHNLFPIPEKQLQLNPNLYQNPNY